MGKKDHQLVTYVDADTHKRFNALAERLGDRPSALLRKLIMRTIREDPDGVTEMAPSGSRKKRTIKSPD